MKPCLVCSRRGACREKLLYVVEDRASGLVKIGATYDLPRRLSQYRQAGLDPVVHTFRPAGCDFRSIDIEERALKRLAKVADRFRGDWFRASVEQAAHAARGRANPKGNAA